MHVIEHTSVVTYKYVAVLAVSAILLILTGLGSVLSRGRIIYLTNSSLGLTQSTKMGSD